MPEAYISWSNPNDLLIIFSVLSAGESASIMSRLTGSLYMGAETSATGLVLIIFL